MERFRLFELFKEEFEFLILFIPLVLLDLDDLDTFNDFLMVLYFFFFCNLLLYFLFHLLLLQFPLPLFLLNLFNFILELFVVVIDQPNFLHIISNHRMIWRVVVVTLCCYGLDFLQYFDWGYKLLVLNCHLIQLATHYLTNQTIHSFICYLFQSMSQLLLLYLLHVHVR